jgi:glycerophosphoryl diester phosphodiesterase
MSSDPRAWSAVVLAVVAASCDPAAQRVAHPTFADGGLLAGATPMSASSLASLQGTWSVGAGADRFGPVVAISGAGETVSIFAARNDGYAVLRAGCVEGGARLVLEGTWRYAKTTDTGLIRLFVEPPELAQSLCAGAESLSTPQLSGALGEGYDLPSEGVSLAYRAPLRQQEGRLFRVVAHRGGCRTSDDCGASENSVEVIRLAQSLGATAVEVDVRLTSDGVPILYHDDSFNARLVRGEYCHGPVEEFTFAHVRALCTLRYGEQIPTLEEALRAMVEDTTLRGLWMDLKTPAAVGPASALASQYMDLAEQQGRQVSIVTGLGEREIYDAFISAGLAGQVPCLVELEPSDVRAAGCKIFAPRWTRGPMPETVRAMQAEGRLVTFWTLDEADFIDLFLRDAVPNGLLTNRPGLVFHRFQMIGTLPPEGTEP